MISLKGCLLGALIVWLSLLSEVCDLEDVKGILSRGSTSDRKVVGYLLQTGHRYKIANRLSMDVE